MDKWTRIGLGLIGGAILAATFIWYSMGDYLMAFISLVTFILYNILIIRMIYTSSLGRCERCGRLTKDLIMMASTSIYRPEYEFSCEKCLTEAERRCQN